MSEIDWTAATLLRTGVELRLLDEAAGHHVTGHLFADLDIGIQQTRVWGGANVNGHALVSGEDPMAELADLVQMIKDLHRGDFYGELRIEGVDLTRSEFYAAPFQVELSAELQRHLAGWWDGRDPRQAHGLTEASGAHGSPTRYRRSGRT